MRVRRVLALARAEVLHVVRDRVTLGQVLVVPIVQLLVLVHAATFVLRDTPTWVVDQDGSRVSRGLVARLAASGHFEVVGVSASPADGEERLLSGEAALVLGLPPGLARSLARDGHGVVELQLDAARGTAAAVGRGYAAAVLADVGREIAAERGEPPAPRIELRVRHWYNPGLDYRHYMVPGLLVALVTLVGTVLAAQSVARENELGTLEQLRVTPLARSELIAAKLLPLWVLGMVDFAVGLAVGRLAFGVPLRGDLTALFAAAAVYLVVALAIGLFVSSVAETQQQAMFVAFFVLNVYLLLSGLLTPIDAMAPWVEVASRANPVRWFVALSRDVLVRGAGWADVAQPFAILCAFAAVTLTLAVLRVRKRAA